MSDSRTGLGYLARVAVLVEQEPSRAVSEELYVLAAHIRNMSWDDAWKEPASAIREACNRDKSDAEIQAVAKVMLETLPYETTKFEPLNYATGHAVEGQA